MLGTAATVLVLAGIAVLLASLPQFGRLIAVSPQGRERHWWRAMAVFAALFIAAFVAYLGLFEHTDLFDLIVPTIFFLGASFVWSVAWLTAWIGEQVEARRRQVQTAVDNMSQGLLMFDRLGRIMVSNRPYIEMYRLSPAVVVPGCTLRELMLHRKACGGFVGDVEQYCRQVEALISAGKTSTQVLPTAEGRSISIVNQPMVDGGWVVTHEDITERIQIEEQIVHLSLHDPLTDLPNRTLFRRRLEDALASRGRDGALTVLYLDLDLFKTVNDTLGHPVGDALLKAIAVRLRTCVRETDTLARLGGDEFAIVQIAVSTPLDAAKLAHRIHQTMALPFDVDGHQMQTDFSIGIAVVPSDGVDPDELIRNADTALYVAKANGRGAFQFFEPEMNAFLKARRELELDMKRALVGGEFELYYQPIVNLHNETVSGCEALLRWHHPDRGTILPGEFIAVAEDLGMIVPIGEWVLRTACTEAATWPDDIRVAVNLSPIQLMNKKLIESVVSALATSGLPASRLELELTEQALVAESDTAMTNLRRLRELGVRLVMDDFGVGYCSLNYLRRFRFDKIKIDRSFVKDVSGQNAATAIVRAVTVLAGSLGMTTTAEGVETQQQCDEIRALGCDEMQGYFFSVPKPAAELSRFLVRGIERKVNVA